MKQTAASILMFCICFLAAWCVLFGAVVALRIAVAVATGPLSTACIAVAVLSAVIALFLTGYTTARVLDRGPP